MTDFGLLFGSIIGLYGLVGAHGIAMWIRMTQLGERLRYHEDRLQRMEASIVVSGGSGDKRK